MRASSAARTTSSTGAPVDAVTAAAIAPSTSGASAIRSRSHRSSSSSCANRQDGTAEINQDDRVRVARGGAQRLEHLAAVGSEGSVGAPACSPDWDLGPGDLGEQLRQPVRDRRAVRDEHEADVAVPTRSVHSVAYSTMPNSIRQ